MEKNEERGKVRLVIERINNYEYVLEDDDKREYTFNLEFFDLDKPLQIRDEIYMNEELLNSKYEGYSTSYTFGSLESKYGRNNLALDDVDVIKVVTDEKEIYLKRLYG